MSDKLRITGYVSGLDTDSIVQSLMKVERLKVTKLERNKQLALWRQEAYININKVFANFIINTKKNMGLTKTTSTGLSLSNSYNNIDYLRKVSSSNESVAGVSVTSKAVNGNFNIEVKQLASGATFTSAKLSDSVLKDEEGNSLKRLIFKVGGEIIEVGDGTKDITMNDIVKAINSAKKKDGSSLGVVAFYDKENKRLFMQTTTTGKDVKVGLEALSKEELEKIFYGENIEDVERDDETENLIDKLLKDSDKFINSELKKGIKEQSKVGENYEGAVYTIGKDAEILLNGVKLTYSSNNVNINGLNIELKATGKTTISVATNVDGIMEKIQQLVNDYNDLVDKISKALNEKKYSSYYPLSDEEKDAMSEKEIELWEEKAKSGLLYRDSLISSTLNSIRRNLYEKVEGVTGKFDTLFSIGITTQSYVSGATGGKLQIDTAKLRAAIEEDPEGVMELLFKEPPAVDKSQYSNDKEYEAAVKENMKKYGGIFTRIYDSLTDGIKSIVNKAGTGNDASLLRSVKSNILIDFVTSKSSISDIDREVLNINKRISYLNELLFDKEEAYYRKFANLETMLQKMYSQSSWLSQQFIS